MWYKQDQTGPDIGAGRMKTFIIDAVHNETFWRFLQTGVGTLVGAAAGAYFAFRFERIKRRDEQAESNVAEGNNALFILGQMWNVLHQYQKEPIADHRDSPGKWISMPATVAQPSDGLAFKPTALGFLFQSSRPNILNDLLLEQRRFQLALALIKRRSRLLTDSTFPKVEQAGIMHGDNVEMGRLEQVVGANDTNQLRQLTDAIITNVDENVESFRVTFGNLREALTKQFPKKKFIRYSFDGEPPPNADATQAIPPQS